MSSQRDSGWRNWGDHPIIVTIGAIAALVAIIAFTTGKNLPDLINPIVPTSTSVSASTAPISTSVSASTESTIKHVIATVTNDTILRLEGTAWEGTTIDNKPLKFLFKENGTIEYTTPSGTFKNGYWSQDGNIVHIEINDKYAEYNGIINGGNITGTAKNKIGTEWTWSVNKQ